MGSKKLDHEIENLRQKIGYTRSGFYRYSLTRLLEQMLLSKRKEVQLAPWDEVVGTLQTIETESETITAVIACTQNLEIALLYSKDTAEAAIIQEAGGMLGQRVRIIKTDDPGKPIIIRTFCATTASQNSFLQPLWLRKTMRAVLSGAFFRKEVD